MVLIPALDLTTRLLRNVSDTLPRGGGSKGGGGGSRSCFSGFWEAWTCWVCEPWDLGALKILP